MIRRIFKVYPSPENDTMALNLASLLSEEKSDEEKVTIHDFYWGQGNPFDPKIIPDLGPATKEFDGLLFMGYSEGGTFGDYSPEQFADHFAEAFDRPKKRWYQSRRSFLHADKQHVRHLYLVGPSLGLASKGENNSYAQHLANRLHEKGFTQIRVHAVAHEKREPGESMTVEVLKRTGAFHPHQKPGYLAAYTLDAAQRRGQTITDFTSPRPFLSRPENTFIPHESYRLRNRRIREAHERETRAYLIKLLSPLEVKHTGKKKAALTGLLAALRNNNMVGWQQLCVEGWRAYDKEIIHNPLDDTPFVDDADWSLLKQLSEGDLPSLQEARLAESKHRDGEIKLSVQDHRFSVSRDLSSFGTRPVFFPAVPLSPKAEGSDIPKHLTTEIEKLHEALQDEIDQLRDRAANACLTLFLEYEIRTKILKKDSLAGLLRAKSLGELQERANAALRVSRVTRGFLNSCPEEWNWGQSRTRDLLKRIVTDPHRQVESEKQHSFSLEPGGL